MHCYVAFGDGRRRVAKLWILCTLFVGSCMQQLSENLRRGVKEPSTGPEISPQRIYLRGAEKLALTAVGDLE